MLMGSTAFKILVTSFLFVLSTSLYAQDYPPNDECEDAIVLECGDTVVGHIGEARVDYIGFNLNGTEYHEGIWYGMNTEVDLTYQIDINYPSYAPLQMVLYDASCQTIWDKRNVNQFPQRFRSNGPIKILIFQWVDRWSPSFIDSFQMTITCASGFVSNDECQDAIEISTNENIIGDLGAALRTPHKCGYTGHDVFYTFQGNDSLITVKRNQGNLVPSFHPDCGTGNYYYECLNIQEEDGSWSILTERDSTYYMSISGFAPLDHGEFDFTLSSRPYNNTCADAVHIDSTVVVRGLRNYPIIADACSVNADGQWYEILGDNSLINIRSYFSDPRTSVFEGNCDALTCTPLTESTFGKSFFGVNQKTFLAHENKSYKIRVAPHDRYERIIITRRPIASNDLCATARPLPINDTVHFDLNNALMDTTACDTSLNPTIWFTIAGNNEHLILRPFADDYNDVQNSSFQLYEGDCNSMTCIASEAPGYLIAHYHFLELGKEYYLSITSAQVYEGILAIQTTPTPEHDTCTTAKSLVSGQKDTVIFAGLDSQDASCDTIYNPKSTVWYSYVGDGDFVTIETNAHQEIFVYTGSCNDLNCLDFGGSQGYYYFETKEDSTYYISISGDNLRSNQIALNSVDSPPNSTCRYAKHLSESGTYEEEFIHAELAVACDGEQRPKRWYTFEGNDSIVHIRIEDLEYSYSGGDNLFEIWEGTCEELVCIGSFYNHHAIKSEAGKTYYIAPIYYGIDSFTLEIQSYQEAQNNRCSTPDRIYSDSLLKIDIRNYSHTGTKCYDDDNPDIWYKILGDGQIHSFQLLVRNGESLSKVYTTVQIDTIGCHASECMTSFPYGNFYLLDHGQEYNIRINPDYNYADSLFLKHKTHLLPEHRVIEHAIPLTCQDSIIHDSFDFAFPDLTDPKIRLLWYGIEGNNSLFTLKSEQFVRKSIGFHLIRKDSTEQYQTLGRSTDRQFSDGYSMSFYALQNYTYYVLFSNINGQGHLPLDVDINCEPTPSNYNCQTAEIIDFTSNRRFYKYSIINHQKPVDPPKVCKENYGLQKEFWYKITSPKRGKYVLDGKNINSIELYDGNCESPTILSCENISIADGEITRLITDTLEESGQYLVRIMADPGYRSYPKSIKDSIQIAFFDYHDYLTGDREHALELILGDEECEDNEIFSDLFNRNDIWVKVISSSSDIIDLNIVNRDRENSYGFLSYEFYVNEELQEFDYFLWGSDSARILSKNMTSNDTMFVHLMGSGDTWRITACAQNVNPEINDTKGNAIRLESMDHCRPDTFNICYTNNSNISDPECHQDPKHKFGDLWFKVKTNCVGAIKLEIHPFSWYSVFYIKIYDPVDNLLLKCQRVERSSNNVFINEDLQPNQDYLIRIEEVDINSYRNHCSDFSICAIEVPATKYPLVSKLMGPQAVCPDETMTITYEVTEQIDALSYKWTYGDTTVVTTTPQMTLVPSLKNLSSGIKVVGINHCGESDPVHMNITIPSPSHCALSSCLRTNTYIDNSLLHILDQLDVYRAAGSIQSDATIESAYAKYFKAGKDVTLYPNFEVKKGATFVADIESCIDTLDNRP